MLAEGYEDAKEETREREVPTRGRTSAARAAERIKMSGEGLQFFRQKVHDLRRLVAGDYSPLLLGPAAAEDGPENDIRLSDLYDIIVTDFHEGRSNELLKAVKALLMQTTHMFPKVEFEDLPPLLAAINSGYCKDRLGPEPRGCGANDEMRMALLDYFIGGMGFSYVCLRDGKASIMAADSLDVTWDRSGTVPTRMRWASCRWREPLWYWMETFPEADWFEDTGELAEDMHLDKLIELEFYYDIEGPKGAHHVFRCTHSYGVEPEPIFEGDNPHYMEFAGKQVRYLPLGPMYFMALPSVASPIGVVEQVLPNQIACWEEEESFRMTSKAGNAAYLAKKGTFGAEAREALESGRPGLLIEYEGDTVPQRLAALEPGAGRIEWYRSNKQEITSHSGVNPYTQGAPPEGIEYAREVQEISAQSGLTAGHVARDFAAFWVRTIQKFLALAAAYDDEPLSMMYDGVPMVFDAFKPVRSFLQTDADIVIREDTMQYRPREARVAEALNDLKVAMKLPQFPNALPKAYEAYLRARGEQNVAPWLEAAPMMPAGAGGMPLPGGVPGQMGPAGIGPGAPAAPGAVPLPGNTDPGAAAEASTV